MKPRPFSSTRVLPCGVMGKLPVVFGSDEILPAIAEDNTKHITDHWDVLWPILEKALLKEMREYDADEDIDDAEPLLHVTLPDQAWSERVQWSLIVGFEPFNGTWIVEITGSKKVKNVIAEF